MQLFCTKVNSLFFFKCLHTFPGLQSFVNDIRDAYDLHKNPFHNFYHGFDVFHTVYLFLKKSSGSGGGGGAAEKLDKLSIFAALLAALCHDVAQ